jgi:hypothetical protein
MRIIVLDLVCLLPSPDDYQKKSRGKPFNKSRTRPTNIMPIYTCIQCMGNLDVIERNTDTENEACVIP